MNVGIRRALAGAPDYVWLLNIDAFPDPDCARQLVAALESDRRLFCVTPRLMRTDGTEQHAGARMRLDPFSLEWLSAEQLAAPVAAGAWLTGTALMVRASACTARQWFDRRFFAYWEDVDFQLAAVRRGAFFRAVPEARCLHLEGASSGGGRSALTRHLMTRNRCLLLRKYLPPLRAGVACAENLSEALAAAAAMSHAAPDAARAMVGAIWSVLTFRYERPSGLNAPLWFEALVLWRPFRLAGLINALCRLLRTAIPSPAPRLVPRNDDRTSGRT
jgi:hypothetical protein